MFREPVPSNGVAFSILVSRKKVAFTRAAKKLRAATEQKPNNA
jgi:hypothetical protein